MPSSKRRAGTKARITDKINSMDIYTMLSNRMVMKKYRVSIKTRWGSIIIDDVEAKNEDEAKNKAEEMLLEEIEHYSDFDSVDEYD